MCVCTEKRARVRHIALRAGRRTTRRLRTRNTSRARGCTRQSAGASECASQSQIVNCSAAMSQRREKGRAKNAMDSRLENQLQVLMEKHDRTQNGNLALKTQVENRRREKMQHEVVNRKIERSLRGSVRS